MLFGIITGVLAALGQSCSYIFSRNFAVKFGNPFHLMIYSQLIMGVFALILLPFVFDRQMFRDTGFILPLVLSALGYLLGQGSFFAAIREVEASRLSSLLGLKLLVLAGINIIFFGVWLNAWQWAAVLVCVTAALLMNWSGGRLSWKMLMWLFLCCVFYSLSDIFGREMILRLSGDLVLCALTGTALCYILLGIIAIPLLFLIRRSRAAFLTALPFAVCWFMAMLFLFICFAAVGTVFGNIVQSSRGVISVLLGMVLIRLEMAHLESRMTRRVLFRRIFAALLMMMAIILYTMKK